MELEQARELLEERTRLRGERDFAAADAVRDRLREAGWEVVDTAAGSELHAVEKPPEPLPLTYLTLVHGWPDDARRWLDGVRAHAQSIEHEVVVVDNSGDAAVGSWTAGLGEGANVITLEPTGWGAAANAGVKAARGDVVVLFDPGVELTGPVDAPLLAALADPGVAVAGAFGVRGRGTVKEFDASPGPVVDAVEGYCMAFRRADFLAAGGFDYRFKSYRIADFELSFRLRAEGGRDAVVIPGLPVQKHEHRLWEAMAPEERDRVSKRNFYRFLERWGDRPDLLVSG